MGQAFPLGTSDFRRIRELNRFYIDKTAIIEQLENDKDFITFLRPRRFGKSLLVSTLFYYYDIQSAKLFDELFGNLYIGQHPTEEKNSYYVLKLNFSELEYTASGKIEISFREMILHQLKRFIRNYSPTDKLDTFLKVLTSDLKTGAMLSETVENIAGKDGKVYVLIDEYDHFTNRMIFSELIEAYKSAVQSSGFIRQFFTTLKALTSGSIKRIFITGILPILLNDITSGYNISKSINKDTSYQGSMGFTPDEVKKILQTQDCYSDELFVKIQQLYNGFMFADDPEPTTPHVFNPQMVLSYIDSISQKGKPPKDIINSAFLSDKKKFEFFMRNPKNIGNIMKILELPAYASTYTGVLDIKAISNPMNLATLFFHFGLLTFQEYTPPTVFYKIPNRAMRELYYEYFKEYFQARSVGFENIQKIISITQSLFRDGDIRPLISFLQNDVLDTFSFRETIGLSEQSLKFILLMFFKFTPYYDIRSEQELVASKNQGGYSDLSLVESTKNKFSKHSDIKFEWLFELKYVPKKGLKLTKNDQPIERDYILDLPRVKAKMKEGISRLQDYKIVYEKKNRSPADTTQMKYVLILFVGKEFVFWKDI